MTSPQAAFEDPPDATRPPRAGQDPNLAARAQRIVADIAERLADPDQVSAIATAPGNVERFPGLPEYCPWTPRSLSEGFSGTSLLFAELGATQPRYRRIGHAHLARAARSPSARSQHGLFQGTASLAFAALIARQAPGDYAELLEQLDHLVTRRLRDLLAAENERLDAGRPGVPMHTYDVISGAAGLGRYLLLRHPLHDGLVADALGYLVRLAQAITVDGTPVPGWWVPDTPTVGREADFPRGHLNLGLAHGICGPLTLLTVSRNLGVRVAGQDDAINGITEWVLARQRPDGQWPAVVRLEELLEDAEPTEPSARTAWCYGTPGVARALFLAGRCLGRTDWQRTAVEALAGALAHPHRMHDWGLCHGWSGLLQVTWRMARESGDERLAARLPEIACRVVDDYTPDAPFGLRYEDPKQAPNRAGFLEGAAGAALALHTYAADAAPRSGWDAALFLV